MGEAIDPRIGVEQYLNRPADPQKIGKLINLMAASQEHIRAGKHQHAAQVQQEHGLNRPLTGR